MRLHHSTPNKASFHRSTSPLGTAIILFLFITISFIETTSAEDEYKGSREEYFKAIYKENVKIGPGEKDKLVPENISITFEFYTEIPRHYFLSLDNYHYTMVVNPSGLNATLVGNPTPISAVKSNGLMVDGVANSVKIDRSATQVHECFYDLSYCREGFTIGFWINFPQTPTHHVTVMSSGGEDGNHGFSMSINQHRQMTFLYKLKTGKEWKLVIDLRANPVEPNRWYHFIVTWSPSAGAAFYINGQHVRGDQSQRNIQPLPLKEPRQFWIGRAWNPRSQFASQHPSFFLLDEIHFWMDYKTSDQIQELGPVLYYQLPIGHIRTMLSSSSTHLPYNGVTLGGRPKFVKDGKSMHTLEFNGRHDSLTDDISNYCFYNCSSCFNGFLLSTWLKFSDLSKDGVVVDTGHNGFHISLKNASLVSEVFMDDKMWKVSWGKLQVDQWYFVELSMDPSEGLVLLINQQAVSHASYKHKREHSHRRDRRGGTPQLHVAKSSYGDYDFTPATVDEFKIWYGDRVMLQNIGYILRGKPAFYHFPMDELEYNRIPHHNLSINVFNNPRLIPGKVKNAIDLDGDGQYIFIPPNQPDHPPCFGNLNYCKHGATVSMWLKFHDLLDGRHFLSTGTYGFNMWQEEGRTKATARVADKEWWLVTDKLVPERWQFVELNYDPSKESKLEMYVDGLLVSQSDTQGNQRHPHADQQYDGLYFARGDGTRVHSRYGRFTIDEVEYWLANRDYLIKYNYIHRGQLSDYIHLNMDEIRDGKMVHRTFKNIQAINQPHLTVGRVNNALNLNGNHQYLDVGKHSEICFGNVAYCLDGLTNAMWLKFHSMEDYSYVLSNGKGIQIYTLNNQLVFEIDVDNNMWKVAIPGLKMNKWYFVEYTWQHDKGLSVYINNRLMGRTSNYVTSPSKSFTQLSTFKIGSANEGEPGRGKRPRTANAVVDEFEFWYSNRDALIASGTIIRDPITYILFPFEEQQGTTVPHPNFNIYLHNGAKVTSEGRIGNGLVLAGREEYVTFGDQSQVCMGNLQHCPKGLTISMHLKPQSLEHKATILSAAPYHIYTDNGKLEAEFTNGTHVWRVSVRGLRPHQWQQADFSWDPIKGLEVFLEDRLVGSDHTPQTHQPYITDHTVYLGRPTSDRHHKGFRHSNSHVDELQYWYASKDLVDTDPVINNVILDMDVISNTRLLNPYTTILAEGGPINVAAINATGVKLNGHYQYLHTKGSQLVCHGNLDNCQRGFTYRLKLQPQRLQDDQYILSSSPLDLFILDKKLNAVLKTPSNVWRLTSKPLETEQWYQIDISWCPEEGAMIFVNGEKQSQTFGSPNPDNTQWSFDPSKDLEIGQSGNHIMRGDHLSAVLDDMQMWHARRDILLHHNLISRESLGRKPHKGVKFPPTYNSTHYRIIYDGHTWVHYDLSVLPSIYHQHSPQDLFSISFRTRHPDGLIYYNGDDRNNVQLLMQGGLLYLVTVSNGQQQRYQVVQHRLDDDQWHELLFDRHGQILTVTIDRRQENAVNLEHVVNLLQPTDTYLGGINTTKHRVYYINQDFRGQMKDVWIWGNLHPHKIYLGRLPFVYPSLSYVNITGRWQYERDDRIPLVTPPLIHIIIDVDHGKKPKETVPVTFYSGHSHIFLREGTPAVDYQDSFELKYKTLEPNGVLVHFSKSPHSTELDSVIELFDGKPYLVANFGRGHRRIPFGNRPEVTNDNREHFLRVLNARDSLKLTLDQETYSHDYTSGHNRSLDISSKDIKVFLGGAMKRGKVPWHTWSGEGFKGCVWNVRFNREDDVDLSELVKTQGASGIAEQCRESREDCLKRPCRNNGHCVSKWESHHCDCADTIFHGPSCELYSRYVTFGGQDRLTYSLSRPFETHTNDISLRFKTLKENTFLFSMYNQASNDVIKVDLERGIGKVETRFNGQNRPSYTTFECNTPLNDNNWHTLHLKRRANYLEAYVDNCYRSVAALPEENFKFSWDKVTLGDDQRNPFVGHLQNFIIDDQHYFNFIDSPNPDLQIYTSVKTSDREQPIIVSPITIHRDSNAHFALPPLQVTGDSKLQVMFKTTESDGIILYNPGAQEDFLAVELSQGRLLVRGNEGTGMKEVESRAGALNDNQWHSVDIRQQGSNRFDVTVDGRHTDSLSFPKSAHTMDLHSRLYVGFVDESLRDRLGRHTRSSKGFAGCLASLVVNRMWHNIDVAEFRSGSHITSGCTDLTKSIKYCIEGICKYGGYCHEVPNGFRCDCGTTTYVGERCQKEAEGLRFGERNGKGIGIYNINPPQTTDHDMVAFGFMTYSSKGTLLRLDSADKKDFTEFKLEDGRLVTTYKVGGDRGVARKLGNITQRYNDGAYHRVLYIRNGGNATVIVDDLARDEAHNQGDNRQEFNRFNHMSVVKMGGNLNAQNKIIDHYNGILAGVYVNGRKSIDEQHIRQQDTIIATHPFNIEQISIKVSVKPIDITRPTLPTLPPGISTAVTPFATTPSGDSGGGGGWKDGVYEGGPRYDKVIAKAPVQAIGGPGARAAGAVGAMLGVLLLGTSLMWALFRFKPGLLPGWAKLLGPSTDPLLAKTVSGTGNQMPTPDLHGYEISEDQRVLALNQDHLQAAPQAVTYTYERTQTFTQPDQGNAMMGMLTLPNVSMRNVDLSYGGFNQQDIFTQQQQQRMLQQQQQLMSTSSTLANNSTMGRNYMAAEEIRVDCVQMTNNGRYVVTGSNCGPPQVWDLKSGELVRVMRGDQFSSTDLHLANGDTLLVGQVAELEPVDSADASNRFHQRKLQLWDFETGKPLETHRIETCTASCMMNDGERIVLGRTDKFGGGTTIVVYDLLAKEPVRSFKCDSSFGFADQISYLNVSKDNRYIIAGFQNSYDNTANFASFDLASNDPSGLKVASLDASVEVTAVLNESEAVTGNKRGELVVWSMKTGQLLRTMGAGGLLHGGSNDHHGEVKDLAVSRDGQFLVSASADGTLKVWDVESEQLLHTLVGHKDEVWCCCLSPDNELVGSGSKDGTIRMWKVSDGSPVAAIDAGMTIFKVLLSNNKKTVVALGDKGGARKLIMLKVVRSTATIDRRGV